jgi:adenylate cyclase class IV
MSTPLRAIIEKLGYKLSVRLSRNIVNPWHFRNVEIVLDELPFGYFMEIEGSMKDILVVEKQLGC